MRTNEEDSERREEFRHESKHAQATHNLFSELVDRPETMFRTVPSKCRHC